MIAITPWRALVRVSLVGLLTAVASAAPAAAAGPDVLWQGKLTIGAPTETTPAIALDASAVYVAGAAERSPGDIAVDTDLVLSAYDPAAGDLLWRQRFNIPGHEEFARAVAAGHGLVVVGGGSTDLEENHFAWLVRAHDARTGALRWSDQGGPGPGGELAQSIAIGGGRVFAAGTASDANGFEHWFVRAYDAANGHVIWEEQADFGGPVEFASRVAFSAGRVVAVGVGGPQGSGDWLVRAYDAATGRVLWHERLDLFGGTDQPDAMALRGRHLFVAGSTVHAQNPGHTIDLDWLVRSYDAATGAVHWQDRFDLAGREDLASSLAASSAGVFVAGSGTNAAAHSDFLIRAYRPRDGKVLWSDQVEVAPQGDWLVPTGVATLGNRVVVSSATNDASTSLDWLVRTYKAREGGLLWQDRFDLAGGYDTPGFQAIAAGAHRAFVLGTAAGARRGKLVVRAYDVR